jgi:putative transposase
MEFEMTRERKSTRLQGYNYSSDNLYFITSCVQNRICCLGEIVLTGRDLSLPSSIENDGQSFTSSIAQMKLNKYGEIARNQWTWLSEQYRYVILHAFVVMPNHIHGILEINRSRIKSDQIKIKPLTELIGAYKTTVSKQIHLAGFIEFQWQRSFFEHIIRDEKSLVRISDYIFDNPKNWEQDEFYN